MQSLFAVLLVLAIGSTTPQTLRGVYALQASRSQTQAHLVATQIGNSPLAQRLDLWMTRDRSRTVDRYAVEMTKYLHLIAIGDDLTTFLHVHPALGADHHFHIDMVFPKEGLYHVYADGDPDGAGQQVFRYDLSVGSKKVVRRPVAPTGAQVATGPYRVSLAATELHVGSESALAVHITCAGRPANDLHPYLGALAHAVFIDTNDLSYAHVHPMPLGASTGAGMPGMSDMPGMPASEATPRPLPDSQRSSPDMLLHITVHEAGTYKLWLQFRGKDGLHAAPFVLTAA